MLDSLLKRVRVTSLSASCDVCRAKLLAPNFVFKHETTLKFQNLGEEIALEKDLEKFLLISLNERVKAHLPVTFYTSCAC